MKNQILKSKTILICLLIVSMFSNICFSQIETNELIAEKEKTSLIKRIADSLEYYYVDLKQGKEIGKSLIDKLNKGSYKSIKKPLVFAETVTSDLRAINGDLHLFLNYTSKKEQNKEEKSNKKPESKGRRTNYGFQEIKFIEGNIAYLKINHFSYWDNAANARIRIVEIMSIFKGSSSFIIDLRDNRGGVPFVASFLASYFFEEHPVHLADFYTRFNNYKYGIYTEPFVPGYKYANNPIYILVNKKSASAAEEFAFWLQNHKRATIIGQPTAGAGYGALNHQLNEGFTISISSEEEINPLTKKGFQGTGVVPDILVNDSTTLEQAIELACKQDYRSDMKHDDLTKNLNDLLKGNANSFINQTQIFREIMFLNQMNVIDFEGINELGNKSINEPQKAVPIFMAFKTIYSFYPHPFIEYAKALEHAKRFDLSLINYNKAIQLAKLKNNPALKEFELKLAKFLEEYKSSLKN